MGVSNINGTDLFLNVHGIRDLQQVDMQVASTVREVGEPAAIRSSPFCMRKKNERERSGCLRGAKYYQSSSFFFDKEGVNPTEISWREIIGA